MREVDQYVRLVSDYVKIPIDVIKSKVRKREVCEARQVISYILLLHTKLSQQLVAEASNYKSHASAWRDKGQVTGFLQNNKAFAAKYELLLTKANILEKKLAGKESSVMNIEKGDLCWFWNEDMKFPILETFKCFSIDYQNRIWFRTNDEIKPDYSYCRFAGEIVLPTGFKISTFNLSADTKQIDEEFFDESLIQPGSCKSTTIPEPRTEQLKFMSAYL